MSIERLRKENLIDYAAGVRRFCGNNVMYEEFLIKFSQDASFGQAAERIAAKDYEGAFPFIHNLTGLVGNLSMDGLYGYCLNYIGDYREGKIKHLDDYFNAIKIEHAKVIKALHAK
ncbi:MAG: hypothetical protein PHH31_05360 [Acidaminococcaceae bacterium]|nr:hypothetical protein [Acidaminococcaceae bacterium]MDD4721566.1 hypothetical protein [Acidaminococcaceae bacterium]